jgi:hypothetical protein
MSNNEVFSFDIYPPIFCGGPVVKEHFLQTAGMGLATRIDFSPSLRFEAIDLTPCTLYRSA